MDGDLSIRGILQHADGIPAHRVCTSRRIGQETPAAGEVASLQVGRVFQNKGGTIDLPIR
jgi:hypothetical protein